MPGMAVRLVDVAEHAGVSMKTVSNVVNHHPHVSPAMRERVQRSIDELGYRPNLSARQLVTGRTGVIAIALPHLDVPYFAELCGTIAKQAKDLGLRAMIEQTLGDEAQERAVLSERELGLVDGVIFHPVAVRVAEVGLRPDFPLVLLGESPPPDNVDHVMIDNERAAADAVRTLLRAGRSRIAYLARPRTAHVPSAMRRHTGYRTGHRRSGVKVDPSLYLPTQGFRAPDGEAAVATAWDAGVRFDGLLCHDDSLAIGAIRALQARGVAVPDEVAVIGWDDDQVSAHTVPSLSTVRPDKEEVAREALAMLGERIGGFSGPGRHRTAGSRLVLRESTPS